MGRHDETLTIYIDSPGVDNAHLLPRPIPQLLAPDEPFNESVKPIEYNAFYYGKQAALWVWSAVKRTLAMFT